MQLSRGSHPVVTILAVSVAALSFASLPLDAQVTSTTAGEIAVRSNQNAVNLATNPGDDIAIQFDRDVLGATDLAASADHVLSQGKYLVLYSTRWDHGSGQQRAEINTRLSLEPAGGGVPVDLKYGTAQGFVRTASGANEAVVSGGTIVEAAATGDILRLHGTRTDENATSVKNLRGTGLSSIQFLKLDDSWDCLRLSNAFDQAAAGNATFLEVFYDQVDEDSLGAMSLSAGTDITFNQDGRYLVMANTSLLSTNLTSTGRTGYGQRLTLDGTPVAGSTTTTYVRGHPNADGCHDGVLSIGTIIQATAGQVLNVQTAKEQGVNCTITSAGTGLAIVQLPSTGSYISLSDNSGQDLNAAGVGASVNFGSTVSPTGLAFSHTSGTSAVTVNKTGTYLFLSSFFCLEDTTDRQVPWQTWKVNGTTTYGGATRYSRNNQIDQNGNWSGFLASLTAVDTVEVNSQALAAGGILPGNDLGLQGVHIESLFPSDDPQISFNASLNALVGSTGAVITDETHLLVSDANTGPESLIYTITSAITGGVLNLGGVPLAVDGTFTQEDVNNDLLTFDADAAEQTGGFDFSVSDGGVNPATGTFVINVGIVTLLADDNGVTDEDTALFFVEPGASPSLLDNDAGTMLTVVAFDATSTQGAAVTVAQDGTFTYDPGSAPALQALAVGEQAVDTFTYTVADFQGNTFVATANITVPGVNDDPVVVSESVTSINGSGITFNLLRNESDIDASDVLTISNAIQEIFGGGGAVSSETFNFELVPLVFASQFGATVSVSSDGTLDYDVGTSTILLSLAPGVTLSETFEYTIFDGTSTVPALVTVTSVGTSLPTNDYAPTDADTAVTVDVLSNDSVRGAPGLPTPGAALDLNAADAGNTDSNWANGGSGGGALVMEGAGTASVLITPVGTPVGITAAYDLSGTGSGDQILSTDDAGNLYGGNISTGSYTVEAVFRPDDHVGPEPIWGSGGNGTGSSLVLIDDQLIFTIGNSAQVAQAIATIPQNAIAGGDYVHVLGTFDIAADVASLYVNGVLIDTGSAINITTGAAGNITDWSGTDDEGIGRSAGTTGGDINIAPYLGAHGTTDIPNFNETNDRFDGELAIMRVYSSALTAAQINANTDSVFGVGVPATVAEITDLAGSGPPVIGNAVALPSGATVTLEADGTFTYDPNGSFDHVGVGLVARDSFTYSLDTTTNSTATVNVDVEGNNPDPQISLAADQGEVDEGGSATFSLSSSAAVSGAVDVNLSFSGLSDAGDDFSAAATVQIPDGGNSAQVIVGVLDDNLFEGVENVIVTIESVNGNAVMGAPAAAETLLNDLQSEPVFSIAGNQASGSEGSSLSFTVTPDVASQADRSVTVSYSGTAVNGQDFFGETSLVIPGGDASGVLSFIPIDDGITEGAETVTLTLESVDRGSIGGASSASTEVTDGAGVLLFQADFENVDPFGDPGTPGGTRVGSDAPFAANLGTAVGSWEDIPVLNVSGDLPGIYLEIDDAKGDGIDEALVLDRPVPGSGEIKARLAAPADISGSNAAFIGMDLGNRRTQNSTEAKSWRIIGLDDAGEKSFELYVSANNTAPNNERLHHVDSAGVLTPLGQAADFDNTGSIEEETEQSRLILSLTSGGFRVSIDRWPMDGIIDSTSGVLPYAGSATQISAILFSLSANTDNALSSGIIIDDLIVGGIAGNRPPTATLAGEALADGGSTALPATFIGTGTTIDNLQVDDADAGTGELTATFQSAGAAPLTFAAGGPAVVGGSGTAVLTLTGTLDDINASLAAGVTSTTDGVTGGNAVLSFTIDDGGNTGPGGPKSITHDLVFYVNEGPTVTIDQAAGQDDPTGASSIEFEVVFSEAVTGFEAEDVDLSASTDAGPLSASVSGSGSTYTVSITGMSSGGLVIISVAQGAANAEAGGALTENSQVLDNSVLFIPQLAPSASNLVQDIEYEAGPVDLGDIVVTDPNDSVVTTGQVPQYDYPATHEDSLALVPDPDADAGFAIDLAFQPSGFDDFGTVRVAEIGGTSNGTGIYLIDGIPHFVSKMNSVPADLPSSLNDTDWADGNVCVPLTDVLLPLDAPVQLAVVASLDAITYSVNGLGQATVNLTNRGTRWNWSGDDTIRVGQNTDGGRGGLGTDSEGIFDDVGSFPMEGSVSSARLWHAADASPFSILASSAPEEVTATLSLTPGDGGLTVPAGATFDPATGIWTITGAVREVNAALAAVQFLPNGTSPVAIDVVVDDGDEDGSGPLTGLITVSTLIAGDSDEDGIPDDYEIANGLNPNDPSDAGSDSDNDSWDALSEYLMGTSASDGAERPVFEIVHVNATQVEITYGPILAGRVYEVLSASSGLPEAPAIDSFTAAADGATNTATDSTGGEAQEIYRLQVTVPAP